MPKKTGFIQGTLIKAQRFLNQVPTLFLYPFPPRDPFKGTLLVALHPTPQSGSYIIKATINPKPHRSAKAEATKLERDCRVQGGLLLRASGYKGLGFRVWGLGLWNVIVLMPVKHKGSQQESSLFHVPPFASSLYIKPYSEIESTMP